ncbi:MAG: T9SS type A sorting domain-containing protein [Ignavibacteria bacterium]|nr:T9SS type A sorting domain-containing protein [Ignavibacteria bacterium]
MRTFSLLVVLVLIATSFAYSQQTSWQWVNPLPQGNILNAVWAVNQDTVVAVAEVGTVIRTSNGGKTWQVETNAGGVTDQLFATQFISGSVGWAVGEGGRVMKTTDAAASWFSQDAQSVKDLFAVNFVSSTTGWIGGIDGAIYKTTDGGTTWASESTGTASTIYGFYFLNATTGWAVGTSGAILATTNGGTTWTPQASGTTQSLYSVNFTSPMIGFTTGAFGLILRTSNGGSTWTPQVSGTDLSLYGVQFTSSLTGWAVGAFGTILKTTNGGFLWFSQSSKTYNDLFGVRFINSSVGWAVGDFGTIGATTDGGVTWQLQSSGVKNTLNAIHFPTTTGGWAVGEEGTIVHSTDGGLSWAPQPSSVFQTLYGIYILNSNLGWAVGDSAIIVKTTNGGLSWFEQNSHTDPTLYSVYFVNTTNGWAVGDFGTVLGTTNSGSSWIAETSHTTTSLLKIQFLDGNIGWSVGYGGVIIKTTNGGHTWVNQTSTTTRTLYSLEIIDANKVYVVGDFGLVLYTTNGGTTWITQTTNNDASFYGVTFASPSTGWAVGDDGTVIKTIDAGTTWNVQSSATTHTLWDVQFVRAGTGGGALFAAGLGGTIVCSGVSPLPVRRWTGAVDTLWTTPSNWSPAGPPEKLDSVYIPATTNKPILRVTQQQINLAGLRIAAGTKLTIGIGLSQLVVKGDIAIDGTLEIDPLSSIEIVTGGNFLVGTAGILIPSRSTVSLSNTGQVNGKFYNLFIADGTNISSAGNIDVKNNFSAIGNLSLRPIDTLTILNSDPQAFQGSGIMKAGTVKRAIRQGSTQQYRFESPITYLQFYPTGTEPDTILMTVYPNSPPPRLPDSISVKRSYKITAKGGSNYLSLMSLRYDTAETQISIDNLALFRDSSGIITNMGKTDYIDSDLVAISLDSVKRFSSWYLGRMDYIYKHPFEFTDTLIIRNNGSGIDTLQFGAISGATDGIDPQFGETELPSSPPPGAFDGRWSIPPTRGTLIDLRDLVTPTHQENLYTGSLQAGPGGYPVTLTWNNSYFPLGTFVLRDAGTHGSVFSINMKTQNSFAITNSSVTSFEISHKSPNYYSFIASWNMVSIPLTMTNSRKVKVFPSAISNAFGFSNTYFVADTLKNGRGYWVKFATAQDVPMEGFPRLTDTITVVDGWNMIGSISSPVAAGSVQQIPAGIVHSNYFSFNGSYAISDSIRSAKAYWIKISGTGKLVLNGTSNAPKQAATAPFTNELQQFNTLTITDREGHAQTLYFGTPENRSFSQEEYELPPLPPQGGFDARFTSNNLVGLLTDAHQSLSINIQAFSYPITIRWHMSQPSLRSLKLSNAATGASLHSFASTHDGSVQVYDSEVKSITLSTESFPNVPRDFALHQNYPNPFNPITRIEFDLPIQSIVTIKIFNILGQEVASLVDHQEYVAGKHALTLNASNLASGLYFYRFFALGEDKHEFHETRKMVLMK